MCSKCHEHCHNCCKDAASTTEEKETNNYSCLLSFLRGPHPPTIIKMSESSAPSFVYCRRKLQGNSIEFLSAIAKRSGEDCPYVINSDGPSVAVKEHCVVSEDEHETGTVRVPLMPPILCNGVDCSCPFSFGRSTQLASVSSVSKSAATNFVYGKTKLRQNSVSFLSAMAKTSGEDCLSVISSDGPSAARKEQRLISIHVCGAAVVPHPPVCNIADSPCPSSSQRSPQLPTVSTMSENSACNFVYSRKKLRGNSASFLSERVPAMAKRSGGEDCLSLISSDGPSAARKEQCLICQHEHGAALMPPPTVYSKDDSPCQLCLQRSQLPTASTMSEISACNFIHSRRRMRGKSVTFLSAEVPGIMKRSREDCLSVISSDDPSLAVEEAHVVSQDHRDQHERGTGGALMPPPIAYNSEDSQCRLSLQGTPQLPTSSTMSEISAHNFVYSRRKLRGNSATFLSAQVPGITKRSREDCLSIISSDGPSLVVEEARVVSQDHQDQFERGTGGALPRPPLVCYGEPHVSKSESSSGCSLVEDLVSDEATKKSRPKIIEVDSINDSCSSSKSNMEVVSDSTKTEGDDNGECSSSSIVAAEATGEDQSENDQCISKLRRQGAFEGVWPGETHASAKSIGDGSGSGSSSSRPCKKCFRKGSPVKMLICDNCEDSFHVSCCNPRVKRIPVDEWLCRSCCKKKRIIPKETISRKSLNIIGDMGRCRDASSTGESNPIALMLRDSEPYTGGVRVGKGFQVDIPDWSGPIINDVDIIGKPLVLEPSYFVSLLELKSNKSSKLGSIGNWLQCKQVIDDAAEGGNVTICGKWRRAPLFEVQTAVWECFCCVFWDPIHADCAAPQELETDEVMKQIKYIQMLRPRIAAKHQKLRRASIGDPSFWFGLCYIVASLAIYDEYSNDILDMPEGSCFPRPKYQKDPKLTKATSRAASFSGSTSVRNPLSRGVSFNHPMVDLKPLELLDRIFKECQLHGEIFVSEGLITQQDIDDAKSGKGSRVISIGLPAYCILQALLRSVKANSVGILLSDNVTEITSTNRPKDTFYEWFLNPFLIIKDQIKAENLSEEEEEYLGRLVLLNGDPTKLKSLNTGPPPESERKRAELDALARRLQGITKSVSRYPTSRRNFDHLVKNLSENLAKKNGETKAITAIPRSKSAFARMFSQNSFKKKTSYNGSSDQEAESISARNVEIV